VAVPETSDSAHVHHSYRRCGMRMHRACGSKLLCSIVLSDGMGLGEGAGAAGIFSPCNRLQTAAQLRT
jgi:hypothetical protein